MYKRRRTSSGRGGLIRRTSFGKESEDECNSLVPTGRARFVRGPSFGGGGRARADGRGLVGRKAGAAGARPERRLLLRLEARLGGGRRRSRPAHRGRRAQLGAA